ncbi:MAG: hypothetical protein ACLT3D_03325 [Lawsonibacter sp.]
MLWPGTVDGAILSGTGQEPPATVAAGRALARPAHPPQGAQGPQPCWTPSVGRYNGRLSPSAPRRTGSPGTRWWWTPTGPTPVCRFLPTVGMYHDMMVGLQLLAKPANLARMDPDTPVYFFRRGPGTRWGSQRAARRSKRVAGLVSGCRGKGSHRPALPGGAAQMSVERPPTGTRCTGTCSPGWSAACPP